jgi:hypothetical protein
MKINMQYTTSVELLEQNAAKKAILYNILLHQAFKITHLNNLLDCQQKKKRIKTYINNTVNIGENFAYTSIST